MNADKLKQTVEQFRQASSTLANTLATRSAISYIQRHRALACGQDIVSFASIFGEAYEASFAKSADDLARMRNMTEDEVFNHWKIHSTMRLELDYRLAATYKAMLFFIRAYQDGIYAILLELTGHKASDFSSMQDCLSKERNPVRQRIIDRLPAYPIWFAKMREQRNRIKSGITTGATFSMGEDSFKLLINLDVVWEKDGHAFIDIKEQVSIEDIIEAIRMSTEVSDFTNNWAEEIWQIK